MNSKYFGFISIALTILFASCQNEFDFEYEINKNLHVFTECVDGDYETIKNLSWDFCSQGDVNLIATRAETDGDVINIKTVEGIDWGITNRTTVTKETNVYNSVKETLPDGKQHSGEQCALISTGEPFWIYPIYAQGAYTWDLYVKVGDVETMLCSKGWSKYDKTYTNGMQMSDGSSFTQKVPHISVGTETCGNCGGSGHIDIQVPIYEDVECTTCHGRGTEVCSKCNGQGYTSTGVFTKRYSGCATCGGSGNNQSNINKITKGSGTVTCSKCHGSGILQQETSETQTITNVCSDCSGSGVINGVSNITSSTTNTINLPGLEITAPIGTVIEIYIKNIEGGKVTPNSLVGTPTGSAIFVEPTNIPKFEDPELKTKNIIKFIGIEDTYDESRKQVGGDKDYNDVVLAIIGDNIPQPVVVEDNGNYTVEVVNKKRYMIEDLGASRKLFIENKTDLDFNDLVIDFYDYTYSTHSRTTTYNGGKPVTKDMIIETETYTEAYVRAMGGTFDFSFYVDDKEIFRKGWSLEMLNSNGIEINQDYPLTTSSFAFETMYNTCNNMCGEVGNIHEPTDGYYYTNNADSKSWLCKINDIENYNFQQNNISFKLYCPEGVKENDSNIFNTMIEFPLVGEMPHIIAMPIEKVWMGECVPITKEWLGY